jgi:hypothetical protein
MDNNTYNKLFREMILTGIACGMYMPHEIICNFDHSWFAAYGNPKELDEFLNKAIVDIYSARQCKDLSFTEANLLYGRDLNG